MFYFFLLIYVLSTCGCYKYNIFKDNIAVNSDLKFLFFSKRPTRYTAKQDTLDKPHELGVMGVEKKTWFFEMSVTAVWLWDEVSAVINCFEIKAVVFFKSIYNVHKVHCLMTCSYLQYLSTMFVYTAH